MEPSSCWQPPPARATGILTKGAATPVPFQCVHNYRRRAGFLSGRGYDAGERRSQPRTLPIDKRAAERRGLESRRRIAFG